MAEASARPCQIELVWANPDKTGLELNEKVLGPVLLAMNGGTGTTSTGSRSLSSDTDWRPKAGRDHPFPFQYLAYFFKCGADSSI